MNDMNKIKQVPIEQADKFALKQKLWGFDAYDKEVYAQIAYDNMGFIVKFTIFEVNPLCLKKHHFEQVCEDSCVEFFANFSPVKGINAFFPIVRGVTTLEQAMEKERAKKNMTLAVEQVFRLF